MRLREHALKVFGSNIKRLRKGMSISEEELSHRSSLHRTYIGGIERGERNISLLNIVKLARALQADASKLLRKLS